MAPELNLIVHYNPAYLDCQILVRGYLILLFCFPALAPQLLLMALATNTNPVHAKMTSGVHKANLWCLL